MVYGYARISTIHQSIDRQIKNILKCDGEAVIFSEAFTGTKANRPQWQKLLSIVKSGDTIIFDSVSRMSRNADNGINDYMTLYNMGVNLIFIKEPHINTETYKSTLTQTVPLTDDATVNELLKGVNNFLMALATKQIRLAFEQSEKEVTDLHQRTKEGMAVAKAKGKQIGGVKGSTYVIKGKDEKITLIIKHSKKYYGTLNDRELIKLLGINKNTYYKYLKEITTADVDRYDQYNNR